MVAVAAPVAAAIAIAFVGYPPPYPHRLEALGWASPIRMAVTVAVIGLLLWFGGRPMGETGASGILWMRPGSYNNIRPWIQPVVLPLPWVSDQSPTQPPEIDRGDAGKGIIRSRFSPESGSPHGMIPVA
jgi:hypothetical protein